MPKSLWNAPTRAELLNRLERLSPDAKPRWGRMNAPQMLAHLSKWMQMAEGKLEIGTYRLPVRYPPLKQLLIYWLPWPRGLPTAPALLCRDAFDWTTGRAATRRLIESFATRDPEGPWPEHPAFGKMSSRAWGVLGYRHTDHHFRQFGI